MDEKKFAPILRYDATIGENMPMYYNQPYVPDPALCNYETIKLESGNVYKYYRCATNAPIAVGGL